MRQGRVDGTSSHAGRTAMSAHEQNRRRAQMLPAATTKSRHYYEFHGQACHQTHRLPWVKRAENRRRNKAARRARKVTRRNG